MGKGGVSLGKEKEGRYRRRKEEDKIAGRVSENIIRNHITNFLKNKPITQINHYKNTRIQYK